MKTIGDLLSRDLSRKIEEIIQVDQADEESVYAEITEYVATDSIEDQYHELFRAIAEAPSEPHEGIGVWVSGFFGSGKSSFAKNLGYALQNRTVLRRARSPTLFKQQIGRPAGRRPARLDQRPDPHRGHPLRGRQGADTRKVTERIAELMYTVLLRELDYAEDFDIAELEIELEAEGKLDEFIDGLQEAAQAGVADGPQGGPEALPRQCRPARDRPEDLPDCRLVVARPAKPGRRHHRQQGRRADLRACGAGGDPARPSSSSSTRWASTSPAAATRSKTCGPRSRSSARSARTCSRPSKIVAPCWIVVTSQEKLDEVVAAIDSKRVELAKLQDRFRYRVDLAPSDIREVATKRVLAKKDAGRAGPEEALRREPGLAERRPAAGADDPPHRDQRGRLRPVLPVPAALHRPVHRHHVGHPAPARGTPALRRQQPDDHQASLRDARLRPHGHGASKPIGALVTLDKVYELVEGNLSNEKRTDIHEISQRFKDDAEDHGWALRVAKVDLPAGVRPRPAPHRGQYRRLPGR